MKPSSWWMDLLTKLIFLYSCVLFLGQFYSIYVAFAGLDNPLLPKSLGRYAAFPHFIMAFYWGVAVAIFWTFMKNESIQKNRFWLIPIVFILIFIGQELLYKFLMYINPYG